jgi:cation diffusion facilitator family transporter
MHIVAQRENLRFQTVILLVGLVLMAVKFTAWAITQSNAILTDALESIVNVSAGAFTLYGLWLTTKPSDANHPYGHGKIEFIAASIEGTLISLAGLIIIGKSTYNLIIPHEIHKLDIGLYLTAGAGLMNFALGYGAARLGKRNKSLPLQASGKHLMSDGWTTVGLIIGLSLIIITGQVWLDSVVAIIFGGVILVMGVRILRPSIAGIMDEADTEVLDNIIQVLEENRKPEWIDIHNMRVIKFGTRLHVDCHVTMPYYFEVKQAHDEVDAIEAVINRHNGEGVEFFIHVDPCRPEACPLCQMPECPVRQKPFTARVPWRLNNVAENQRHRLDG